MKINSKIFNKIQNPFRTAFLCLLVISMGLFVYKYTLPVSAATTIWTTSTVPVSAVLKAVAVSSDGTKLAVAGYSTYIYTSTNSGATWTARTGAGLHTWTSIASSADGMKLAAVDGYTNGYIYTSTDGGATWITHTTIAGNWNTIASSADGTKLAVGGYGTYIYTSTNSGATWTATSAGTGGSRMWWGITSSADGTKLAATTNFGGVTYLYTSTNSGATWTLRSQMSTVSFYGITSSSDGAKIAVVTSGAHIYTSVDGGATLVDRTTPVDQWYSITSSSDGVNLSAINKNSYIYTSSDSGATWSLGTLVPENKASSVYSDYGFAQAVKLSSDGSTIVAPFVDGSGKIYIGKDRNTNCDWVGYYPPTLTITSPYPGQTLVAGSSFRIQGSVKYHMTTASAENVTIGWANHDGSQKGLQSLYSTSSSCSTNGCPNSDNTSIFSLAGYATSAPAIIAPISSGTYRFYVYATSTNSCKTDVMSSYQDYVVSQAGQCGTQNTSPVTQFDKNHPVTGTSCSIGSAINPGQTGSSHTWQCSGMNGGATSATCSYVYNDPVDGVCGPDSGTPTKTTPVNLCYVGTATSPTASSSGYAWSCVGSSYGATASCSAPVSNISVTSFKLISYLASTTANECTAKWDLGAASVSASCTLNGRSVPTFSSGYSVPAGVVTFTCRQGSASSSKSVKCDYNPNYKEI